MCICIHTVCVCINKYVYTHIYTVHMYTHINYIINTNCYVRCYNIHIQYFCSKLMFSCGTPCGCEDIVVSHFLFCLCCRWAMTLGMLVPLYCHAPPTPSQPIATSVQMEFLLVSRFKPSFIRKFSC